MLLFLSSDALVCCSERKPTAAPDTTIEHTRQTATTTPIVFPKDSFLADTSYPPLDIALCDEIVEQWRPKVGKKNGQHYTFWEGWV
mmetsp:Transcript_15026/g.38605  ORF Transcript_15026/g.38605 Transcript_15026/m.38605 type:complete len:86 (+) Transcript_15026:85-342(+)